VRPFKGALSPQRISVLAAAAKREAKSTGSNASPGVMRATEDGLLVAHNPAPAEVQRGDAVGEIVATDFWLIHAKVPPPGPAADGGCELSDAVGHSTACTLVKVELQGGAFEVSAKASALDARWLESSQEMQLAVEQAPE